MNDDEELDAARGIILGIIMGAPLWLLLYGVIHLFLEYVK